MPARWERIYSLEVSATADGEVRVTSVPPIGGLVTATEAFLSAADRRFVRIDIGTNIMTVTGSALEDEIYRFHVEDVDNAKGIFRMRRVA